MKTQRSRLASVLHSGLFALMAAILSYEIASAGEFAKIDAAARTAIADHYSLSEEDREFYLSERGIWDLALDKNDDASCHVTITGLTRKPALWTGDIYRFQVCVQKSRTGLYYAQFLSDRAESQPQLLLN